MRVLCVVLALILGGCVSASGASHESPEPVPSFVAVPDGTPQVRLHVDRDRDERRDASMGVPEMRPTRPLVAVPSPRLITVDVGPLAPRVRGRLVGTASWYCGQGSPCTRGYPGGLYAAAGPALRVGRWRGRSVRVCAASRCVRVTLIDCNCGPHANLIDLYSAVWDRLGVSLSRGVMKVTVSW